MFYWRKLPFDLITTYQYANFYVLRYDKVVGTKFNELYLSQFYKTLYFQTKYKLLSVFIN